MKLFDFGLLSDSEKIEVLYNQGVYIGKRKQGELYHVLYQVDSFYVEVIYKKYRLYIDRIHSFSSTAQLDPYLEQMEMLIFL